MLIYPFIEKTPQNKDRSTTLTWTSSQIGFRLHHKATKDPAEKVPSSIITTFGTLEAIEAPAKNWKNMQ